MGAARIKEKNRPSPLWSRRWGYWDTCLPDWRIMTLRDAWLDQGEMKIFVTILKNEMQFKNLKMEGKNQN